MADELNQHRQAVDELGPILASLALRQPLKDLHRDQRLMTSAWLRELAGHLESDEYQRRGPDLHTWYFHG